MGKFRTKIKGANKGKKWQKGQSSTSNPKTQKYRDMAKSRFFQENLGNTGLTEQAVTKHNAMITYGHSKNKEKPEVENDLPFSKEFENMSVRTGDNEEDSDCSGSMKSGTFKTFQTFASDWSQCSNVSFSKLLTRFDTKNLLHKEMLAILAAITEVIKEQGGKETSTEYYAALMQTLRAAEAGAEAGAAGGEGGAAGDGQGSAAALALLSMGLRTVPVAVLRRQFAADAATLGAVLARAAAGAAGAATLRAALGCLSALLRAQERAAWQDSSTLRVFETVLAFVLHAKPKVRKAAQRAVAAVLRGSCFMLPAAGAAATAPRVHPAAAAAAAACRAQLAPAAAARGHRAALHTLALLRDVLPVFPPDQMKATCEAILSLMTHNNIYIKTSCLHTLHALFESVPAPAAAGDAPEPAGRPVPAPALLPAGLAAQLARALLAARPGAGDSAQLLAWTAVMEQAYSALARLDLDLCLPAVPAFARVCAGELWLSAEPRAAAAATAALKVILQDCVRPALAEATARARHGASCGAVLDAVGAALRSPFTRATAHVVLTVGVCFEVATPECAALVEPLLLELGSRLDDAAFSHRREAEAAVGAAVRALGPGPVLAALPLRAPGGGVRPERAWLLPVLRDRVAGATLQYFAGELLELAAEHRRRAAAAPPAARHADELLCSQLWALFPAFCTRPTDVRGGFKAVARVLGAVLKDGPELRAPVLAGLRRLAAAPDPADRAEVARYAKNFLPILLNIYATPASGARAQGQREAALETIQAYLSISEPALLGELWAAALAQLAAGAAAGAAEGRARREAVLDAVRALAPHQPRALLTRLLDDWLVPLFAAPPEPPRGAKRPRRAGAAAAGAAAAGTEEGAGADEAGWDEGRRRRERARALETEHKKAFRVLEELLRAEGAECRGFVADNYKRLKKLLLSTLHQAANSSKAARLRCIEHLIARWAELAGAAPAAGSRLLRAAAAEAAAAARDINARVRQAAFQLVVAVGRALEGQEGGMDAYQQLLAAGAEAGAAAGAARAVSGALRVSAAALWALPAALGLRRARALLDVAAAKLRDPNREVSAAALSFFKVYTKVVPLEALPGSLPVMFEALADMTDDCKRHARLEVGYFLTRMIRKFGAETVERLVPERDELTRRRLRNLRKLHARRQRARAGEEEAAGGAEPARRGAQTLEEILADSDSDLEHVDEAPGAAGRAVRGARAARGGDAWIQDDPDNIVDLADVAAARNITGTDPGLARRAAARRAERAAGAGGFSLAPDGRLLIQDDSDDDERAAGAGAADDDSSDEEPGATPAMAAPRAGGKRRYDDVLSLRSGRSAASAASTASAAAARYRAGGRGIHRPLGAAAAGAAGAAAAGAAGAGAAGAGADYRSKKARGDVKKKGRPDPYAYLPLSRGSLNKRKKSANSKQFSGIVKSKTKAFRNKGGKKK